MGAILRGYEKRVEKELRATKSKGVRETPQNQTPDKRPASQKTDFGHDIRPLVPPLGLREYWYPALPAKKVGKKPVFWVMLGDEMVFFRDHEGEITALSDVCPHRGASLSEGSCFYRGYLSCPYHGATFDGKGNCVAFLTEGPDSKMVGQLKARTYPTRIVRDWVFVWMGEGQPAPLEEDVPPEFFESNNVVLSTYTYWPLNWLVAIENHSDAHNAFYVHRNSLNQLLGLSLGRNRTPVGPKGKIVNNRALVTTHGGQDYYARDGKIPYQMFYPGVNGVWPLHRWRLLWQWFFRLFFRSEPEFFKQYEDWGRGHHLPGAVRTGGGGTRFAVPVDTNLSRIVYFYFPRATSALGRIWRRLLFYSVLNPLEYNFSSQDGVAAASCRFWTPEFLSPTDSQVILLRKLITEHSRDAQRKRHLLNPEGPAPAKHAQTG